MLLPNFISGVIILNKMRIVQLRRNRLFSIIICSIFLLYTLYIVINFFSDKPINNLKEYWSDSLNVKRVNIMLNYSYTI